MKFLIVSHVFHKYFEGKYYAYRPYVNEMNLWLKAGMELIVVAPVAQNSSPTAIEASYIIEKITFIQVPAFNLTSVGTIYRAIISLPVILGSIMQGMYLADHIHLRCPGNMGLLGCFVQIFFPRKIKTAKYAGNWDWRSKQPWTYRIQQRVLRNTFLTRNMTTLVYGTWPDKTKNILPFFTATYSEKERIDFNKPKTDQGLNLIFVGTLTIGKRPLLALKTLKVLRERGVKATCFFCGDGPERTTLEAFIRENNLDNFACLLGDIPRVDVKEKLQKSHFLVFPSKSEGWPKAVAEAMWWGCIPVTTRVSCVPEMLDQGNRGVLIAPQEDAIATRIMQLVERPHEMLDISTRAREWSREYTLERFENDIAKLIAE